MVRIGCLVALIITSNANQERSKAGAIPVSVCTCSAVAVVATSAPPIGVCTCGAGANTNKRLHGWSFGLNSWELPSGSVIVPGPMETRVREKIGELFKPVYLEIENESHKHSVPANSETHFKVIIVSEKFQGLSRLDRQRMVNDLLREEMQKTGGIHALTQKVLTPSEWETQKATLEFQSPPCQSTIASKK